MTDFNSKAENQTAWLKISLHLQKETTRFIGTVRSH